jgi:nicotinamide N-methyltransferase
VVVTDYPDASLVDNMRFNVSENMTKGESSRVDVQGYIWGHPVTPLLDALPATADPKLFDIIILSDLIFNHSQVRTPPRVSFC